MKKLDLLIPVLTLAIYLLLPTNSIAQKKGPKKTKTNHKKEVGPPPWAPAHGYRAKTRYVYFTEHNFYYDNSKGVYIYLVGRNWEVSASIPRLFKGIDFNAAVKIDLDLEANDPQRYNEDHRRKYSKG